MTPKRVAPGAFRFGDVLRISDEYIDLHPNAYADMRIMYVGDATGVPIRFDARQTSQWQRRRGVEITDAHVRAEP